MTVDDYSTVYESLNPRACADRALVLTSLDIPHATLQQGATYLLVVEPGDEHRARHELYLYDRENQPGKRAGPVVTPANHNPWPGVAGYAFVLFAVAWLAGEGAFGRNWLGAGRVDGELIRAGEAWRVFTALTLHKDLGHLLGNLVFGGFFGALAARVIGPGVTWLTVVLMAAAGNTVNTLLLIPSHRSIGASTAVFAALGLVAGFVWRGRLMAQDRWAWRLGPIVGGLALLAYTGTGDESTDIGAHLFGFVCGFAGGIGLTRVADAFARPAVQQACGALAPAIIAVAWLVAFAAG